MTHGVADSSVARMRPRRFHVQGQTSCMKDKPVQYATC